MINICSDIWHNNIITYNKIKYIYMQLFASENFRRKIEFICAYLQGKLGFFPKLHVPHTKTLCKAKMQIWSSIHCCSEGIFPYIGSRDWEIRVTTQAHFAAFQLER